MASTTAHKYINKLQNHRVLVLGGSTGIGFCVAEAAVEHGAHVIISSSNQAKLDKAVGRLQAHAAAIGLEAERISAKTCDLSNPDTIEDNVVSLLEYATQHGKLDHVAFTAGDAIKITPLAETTVADVQKTGMVRQVGLIMLAKHLPKYINVRAASSLTVTGGTNTWRPGPDWAVIAGTGGAVEGLTRGFAISLQPVRVNCVQVGAVHTELFDSIPEDRLPAVLANLAREGITGTVGRPDEVAEAYLYCMKDTFATGGVVESNGGRLVGDGKEGLMFSARFSSSPLVLPVFVESDGSSDFAMEFDPDTPKYVTSDVTSFASDSVRKRWPVILTGAVDDVYRAVCRMDDGEQKAEGKKIIEQLGCLKYEVQHGRKLTPLLDDGHAEEIAVYNKELDDLDGPGWLDVPWLYAECYLYRRISTYFQLTQHWKKHDIFARQKIDTFRTSRNAVLELAARYRELMGQIHAHKAVTHDEDAERLLFAEAFEICLWGNATDLSLLTNLTYEDIQKLQGSAARKAAEENILVNHLPAAYDILKQARAEGRKERRVDIVLDNAGFELYVDLVLAGFLLASGLATQVILRPKSVPWFVSDVLPGDFAALLSAIANPKAFFETQSEAEELQEKMPAPLSQAEVENLQFVFQDWANLHAEGQLMMRPNRYWTTASSFWRLPHQAPELHEDLKAAELVIFKGDLNYRKLTGDAQWDPTTPFEDALGPMGKGSGVSILSLRTCKADVVVGLPAGKDEELRQLEGGGGESGARRWAWDGKWAVVSLSRG
ncbi:DUF89 domain-containing protein [Drechmeria coniospora]|uniref:DUF89 domain-containing protein n=1 Tax=Drechmeria coniospora TaxID=98403 RepID=A0A151GJ69_DRECN|nr:DUF89 domain-containing protein [Drechmeria coniospora]KYK57136.1 DUF89 domain-containing protein [Drechmeria coniospora]